MYQTSADNAFSEGRGAAAEVDVWLTHTTRLPVAGGIPNRVRNWVPLHGVRRLTVLADLYRSPRIYIDPSSCVR